MLNYRNPIIFLEKPTTSCLDILGLHKKCRGRTHQISYIDWAWSSVDTIVSYLQRSNVPWCPTLVLLSQTCFLLLRSGSYSYDRSCWFQAKMIINIRNELPPSCLGSLHQNYLFPWMTECTKWHIHVKIKDQCQ